MDSVTILGVDPGYGRVGVAILKKTKKEEVLIFSDCIETSSKMENNERLFIIKTKIEKILLKYKPDILAIESLLWSKNKKTALKVSEARGVIITEATSKNIEVREFNPNQVKLAVTGYGKSDKKQIINMVKKIIKIKNSVNKKYDDEYDAMAIALTCSSTYLSTRK